MSVHIIHTHDSFVMCSVQLVRRIINTYNNTKCVLNNQPNTFYSFGYGIKTDVFCV